MTVHRRLSVLERTTWPVTGPYHKEPPGPEFEAKFMQPFAEVWERHTAHMTPDQAHTGMERWQVVWRSSPAPFGREGEDA